MAADLVHVNANRPVERFHKRMMVVFAIAAILMFIGAGYAFGQQEWVLGGMWSLIANMAVSAGITHWHLFLAFHALDEHIKNS